MKEIVVIGGGGFVGQHLVRRLLKQDLPVAVVDLLPASQLALRFGSHTERLRFVKLDSSDPSSVKEAIAGTGPVIHLASTVTPAKSNTDIAFDINSNLLFAINVMEALRPTPERRMVFLSSGGTVYGTPKTVPIEETHPTDPICSYGIVKLAIEKYMAMFNGLYGTRHLALRVANPYGPGQNPQGGQGAIAAFVHRILTGEEITIWGDGEVVRDYINIADVVEAIIASLEYDGAQNVFNIGSGGGTSLNELVALIGHASGVTPNVRYDPARAFDVPTNILDIRAAQRELKWSPKIPLGEGLSSLVQYIAETRKILA